MTEDLKKKRRTVDELKAHLKARLEDLEKSQDRRLKQRLLDLSAQCQALAEQSKGRPYATGIGQAASLLGTAAAAIKVEVVQ